MLRATRPILFLLFLWAPGVSDAARKPAMQRLSPGKTLTLSKAGPEALLVFAPATGEYTLQTKGDTDTLCRLYDRTHGLLAADDNSGEARNCRLDIRLQRGVYRLWVRKQKRPVQVHLQAYQKQGAVEDITEGANIQDSLKAGSFRIFRFQIKRRRWLDLQATGMTVSNCRLFHPKGWLAPLETTHLHRARPQRYRTAILSYCKLQGMIEPGTYTLHVYGRQGPSASFREAPVFVHYGASLLRPMQWQQVQTLYPVYRYRYWFQLPATKDLDQVEQTLVFEVKRTSDQRLKQSYWRVNLQRQHWTAQYGQLVGTCAGYRNRDSCSVIIKARAGQRFSLDLSLPQGDDFQLRYYAFTHAETATLGRPARQLANAGQIGEIDFQVAKAGPHWIEVQPPAKSCAILRRDRPLHKRLVFARGISMQANKGGAYKLLGTRLGQTIWFHVPQTGTVTWNTVSSVDTYCQLSDAMGNNLQTDDDGGDKRNCKISKRLTPGYYRIFARILRGPNRAWLRWIYQHQAEGAAVAKAATTLATGCAFVANLKAGPYKLLTEETGTTQPRTTYIVAQADKRPLPAPVAQAPEAMNLLHPIAPLLTGAAPWRIWMPLARNQTRLIQWKIRKSGFYSIQSLGHLQLRCRLLSRTRVVAEHEGKGNNANCHIAQFLSRGIYQIQLQARNQTAGQVGLAARHLRNKRLIRPRTGKRHFAHLRPYTAGAMVLSSSPGQALQVHAVSLDAALRCRIITNDRWTVSNKCQYTIPKGTKKLFFAVHPSDPTKQVRLRILVAPVAAWAQHHPATLNRIGYREDPNKDIPLLLNQPTHGTLSVLGWDAYTFSLSSPSLLQFRIDGKMKARLFRDKRFVGEIASKAAMAVTTMSLKPGQYRLLVRHKDGRINQRYQLLAQVKAAAPGTAFWLPTPSSMLLTVPKSDHIDIQTAGDVDTWCTIEDSAGQLLQRNDNRNPQRWDCHLSQRLTPGQYKLEIGGPAGGTWLSIRQRKSVKLAALAAGPQAPKALQARTVHILPYTSSGMALVTLAGKATSGSSPITCMLESKGQIIQQHTGHQCQLTHLCQKGVYHWRILTPEGKRTRYQLQLQAQALPVLTTTQALALKAGASAHHLSLQVTEAGPHQLTFEGLLQPKGAALTCKLAHQGAAQEIDCHQSFFLGQGQHHLEVHWKASAQPKDVSIALTKAPLTTARPSQIKLPSAQIFATPVVVAKAGYYQLTVTSEDDRRWGCQLNALRVASATSTTRHKCHIAQYLAQGTHQLRLWRPRGYAGAMGSAQGTLALAALGNAKASKLPSTMPTFERKLLAKSRHHWLLPQQRLNLRLVLHGTGTALLLGQHRVLGTCQTKGTTYCQWQTPPSPHPLRLYVATGGQGLLLRASFEETRAASPNTHLRPELGQTLAAQRQPQHTTFWLETARLKANEKASIEVLGDASCVLFRQGPRFTTGCQQDIKKGPKPKIFVVTAQKRVHVMFYRHNHRAMALWGGSRPGKTKDAIALTAGPNIYPLAKEKTQVVWHKIQATGAPIILSAKGPALSCALFDDNSAIIASAIGRHSCLIERPLTKGTYWYGVRQRKGRNLRGSFRVGHSLLSKLSQGTHGPYLLGPAESRWFAFRVKRTGLIGIGAIDPGDTLDCRLFDAQHKHIASGCQLYRKLSKGQYRLQVRLSREHRATALTLKLRGLKPPIAAPPQSFLKRLKQAQHTP